MLNSETFGELRRDDGAVPQGHSRAEGAVRINTVECIRYTIFVLSVMAFDHFRLADLFERSGNRWLTVLLGAFTISYLLTPLVRWFSTRTGVFDFPAERKVHERPTPLLGGVSIYAAFLITMLVTDAATLQMKAVLTAGSLLFVLGILDDVWGVSGRIKFVLQIAVAAIPPLAGVAVDIFPEGILGNAAETGLTIFWIVGITNAFNFLDGMDGLAGGVAAVVCVFFSLIAMRTGQQMFLLVSVALLGGTLGFLPYNFRQLKSATVFLGDTGSTFIGFMLAMIAVMGEWADNDPLKALSIPLLILGVLILDMIYTTVSRVVSGKVHNFTEWLEYTGKDHLHHRLNRLGLSMKESVLFIYALTAILGVGAMIIRRSSTTEVFLELFQAVAVFSIVTIIMLRSRN